MTAGWRARLAPVLSACDAWLAWAGGTTGILLTYFAIERRLLRATGATEVAAWWGARIFTCSLAVALLAALAVWLVGRRSESAPRWQRRTAALAGALVVGAAAYDFEIVVAFSTPGRAIAPLLQWAVVASTIALLSVGSGRFLPTVLRWTALGAAAFLYLQFLSLTPGRRSQDFAEPQEKVRAESTPPLLVLGLDGADWTYIETLARRGRLPNLIRLREGGAWAELETIKPTESPALWTTMATGRSPEEHGVRGHAVERPRGLEVGSPATPFTASLLGLNELRSLFYRTGQLVQGPVTASERRSPAIWNLTTHVGRPLSISSWWATWPAEAILGQMVSDRVYYQRDRARGTTEIADRGLTFPPTLANGMLRLALRAENVSYDSAARFLDVTPEEFSSYTALSYRHHDVRSEFRFYYAMFESHRRFAIELLRQEDRRGISRGDHYVLFRFVDHASHCCLSFSTLVDDHLDATPEALRRFGRVTEAAYEAVDEAVGEILTAFGPGNVVVLSDHGFRREEKRDGRRAYSHDTAPPGIFVGYGPSFRPGRIEPISIYDVFPLLCYLSGLPVAEDLRGRLPTAAISPEALTARPARKIPTWDFLTPARKPSRASEADDAILRELKALGYL